MYCTLPNVSPLELEFQVEYQTQVGIPIWIRIQIGIPSWIVNPLGECGCPSFRYQKHSFFVCSWLIHILKLKFQVGHVFQLRPLFTGENHHPAMFHTATVGPIRMEPGILYNTSLNDYLMGNACNEWSISCQGWDSKLLCRRLEEFWTIKTIKRHFGENWNPWWLVLYQKNFKLSLYIDILAFQYLGGSLPWWFLFHVQIVNSSEALEFTW